MDRFEDMRCFVQVAELQSVTRAADQLNLAPSAVSRRLKDLEARLGAQLLTRTTRRMSLTEAGQVFYTRSQQILSDVAEAEAEVSDESHGLSGTLRVAAPLTFGVDHLSGLVADFLAEHPQLAVELDLSDRLADLVGEGFDLAVRIGTLRDSSLVARRLADVRMVLCAAPDFLRRHGTPADPQDLKRLPCLCYAGSDRPDIWRFRTAEGAESWVQVPMRMRSNNGSVLRDAAAKGVGVTLQPSFIVHRALATGELVPILRHVAWPDQALHVVYPEQRHLSAKSRAFIDHLRRRLAPRPHWDALPPGPAP